MSKTSKHGVPNLNGDERTLESWRADRVQSAQRAVGGHLCLTDQRLIFVPTGLERKVGGNGWEIPLDALVSVDKVGPQLTHVFGGGLRSRLRITSRLGDELFVVNHLEDVRQRLARVVG